MKRNIIIACTLLALILIVYFLPKLNQFLIQTKKIFNKQTISADVIYKEVDDEMIASFPRAFNAIIEKGIKDGTLDIEKLKRVQKYGMERKYGRYVGNFVKAKSTTD